MRDDIDAPQSNGLAIAALVCGILGLFIPFVGIAALICGILALNQGQNKGMAITGVVLGGLWFLIIPVAIIAAIAIPNLLESRVAANEAAAASALKSSVLPAEMLFQAGGYRDADKDGIGEYGSLAELSGSTEVSGRRLTLVAGGIATGAANGYQFVIYVPDDATQAERSFVAYAWPDNSSTGRRVFAMTNDGQVRVSPSKVTGSGPTTKPSWDELYGIGDWNAKPTWDFYRR